MAFEYTLELVWKSPSIQVKVSRRLAAAMVPALLFPHCIDKILKLWTAFLDLCNPQGCTIRCHW
jgi:hypothetical protein